MKQVRLAMVVFQCAGIVFWLHGGASGRTQYGGVNLAGAEFGAGRAAGVFNKHYTYPTEAEADYFAGKGMNVFRLPFLWERLQPKANASLDEAELGRIRAFVTYAASRKAAVILDPHNYGRYHREVIGSEKVPVSVFEDFWGRVALVFKDYPSVIFGLMNEPHGMKTELWLSDANAAIRAIRSTGAKNLILVPGNAYSGAHSWNSDWYGTPNGRVMLGIVDPADNYAFEVHQYLDGNSSGTSGQCAGATIGSQRLKGFTDWLRANGKRGFLGEFGAADGEMCLAALDDMLTYVDLNADVWLGWTYWAAGPWWGNYMFSVEPKDGQDKSQMKVLIKHLKSPAQER